MLTDPRTHGLTDPRTDIRTDTPSYRDATAHLKTGNNVDTSHLPITSSVDSMNEVFFFFPIREMQTRINKPGRAMRFVPRRFCLMVTDIRTYIRTYGRTDGPFYRDARTHLKRGKKGKKTEKKEDRRKARKKARKQ